jgi:hypothetical protein
MTIPSLGLRLRARLRLRASSERLAVTTSSPIETILSHNIYFVKLLFNDHLAPALKPREKY